MKKTDNKLATKTMHVTKQPITETLEQNYMPYAMSVIVSRAIPEIDGFKPAHRKLLYTMYKMGLLGGKRTKSANVVGQTMKLNPHGDEAIYDTLVRLTRANAALLHPYIDSKGNFGKQYSRDMACAASRYTEVRLDQICEELFRGLDKESVDFIDNYDNTTQEPVLLPATFPSVLVNANQGIAVGMASQIASFNLEEVCRATIAYLSDPSSDIVKIMPAPDFESGAQLLYDRKAMRQIYETGRGSFKLRAKYRIDKKNSLIEIFEIPYVSTIEKIIEEIIDLVKKNKIREINDVRDESDKDGFKITIDHKRTADPETLMMKLYRFTELEKSFSCNFNILINGSPRVLGVKQILGEWTSWRRSCVRKEVSFDLQKKKERLHLMQGLEKILLDIDLAIRIIRQTEMAADVVPNLMKGFSIDEIQAEYVADIKLRNLNRQYILNKTADLKILRIEIGDLQNVLENPEKIDEIIIEELNNVIVKYSKPRKTLLVDESGAAEFDEDIMIEDYRVKLFLTEQGYFKKLPLTSLRSAGELKTKEDDSIFVEFETSNKSDLLFFSDKCNVYKTKVFEIKDHKPSDLGEYLPNLLGMDEGEKIVFMHSTNEYNGNIILGFANGKVAKVALESYETKTNRKKLLNAFSNASPVIAIYYLEQENDFAVFSNINKLLVFNSAQIPLKATRTNNGVQVMTSKKGSTVIKFVPIEASSIVDDKYYRTKNIPAKGFYIKEGTLSDKQLTLDVQ